ncbi:MAG: hypothetical protein IKS99_03335 [Firmicutes bacterium]|nr:hypothetical protein [Bacillota bacterium]
MIFAQYFVEFIFYSFLGWIWESIYCTIKEKHWQDRGFLFGPYCPIYGSCIVGAEILFTHIIKTDMQELSFPVIFIIAYLGSAAAEFGTSWVLEKRFHARWWDYSDMPLNIQGRICVPVSICFGIAGVFCVKVLIPWMAGLHTEIPGLVYEGLALFLAAVFGADYALTEASLNALLKRMEDYKADFNERAQETYVRISDTPETIRTALNEQREDLRERRELLAYELKAAAEERRAKREELAEEFLDKINGFQKSKLQNMKRFIPELPEDSGFYENLSNSLSKFKNINY